MLARMIARDTSRISPTAHYTGYVWCRNGLSDPTFETRAGRLLFHALEPTMRALRLLGAPALEDMLMARHQSLDWLLRRAIDSGRIGQVVEIAAGLSPRGYRFMRDHGDDGLIYIEGDLAGMCHRKRALLARLGGTRPGHHIVELDALLDIGPHSLSAVGRRYLRDDVGTAVITEGLVNYFSRPQVTGMWARIARFLARYPHRLYASDMHTASDIDGIPGVRVFQTALAAFTRGTVHIHFARAGDVQDALIAAGFSRHARCLSVGDFASRASLSTAQTRAPVRIIHASNVEISEN